MKKTHQKSKIFLIICLFILIFQVSAQTKEEKFAAAQKEFDEAETLFMKGTRESYHAAREKYRKALALFADVGNKFKQAYTLIRIGLISKNLGETTAALESYSQALDLVRSSADKQGEAIALHNIGTVFLETGDYPEALKFFNDALPLRRQVGDEEGESSTLNNTGMVYLNLGNRQKALEFLNDALKISQRLKDPDSESTTLNNIGMVYSALGDKREALKFYNNALLIIRKISNKYKEAAILTNMGSAYRALGEKTKALDFYIDALKIYTQFRNKRAEITVLLNATDVFLELGRYDEALEYYNFVLEHFHQIGDMKAEGVTRTKIARVYYALGDLKKAFENFQIALHSANVTGDKPNEAINFEWLTEYYWKDVKNPRLAIFYGKQTVNVYQELRSNASQSKELQKNYLKSIEGAYRRLAHMLIAEGRLPEAVQVLNAFKDQQLFDFDVNPAEVKRIKLTPREDDLATLYEVDNQRVADAYARLKELKIKTSGRQPSAEETAQLRDLQFDLDLFSEELLDVLKITETHFSKSPDEKDKVGEIPDLTEMQTALRILNKQTGEKATAIYQLVGADSYSALVITTDGIEKVVLPVKCADLCGNVTKLWALLQSDIYDTTILSKKIYDVVFAPLETKLPKDTTTIMWSLDSNLRYLPMAALFDGKKFLVERYKQVVFTRVDQEKMTRDVSKIWNGVGFGSSQAATVDILGEKISFRALPGVSVELSEIFVNEKSGILQGKIYPDAQFSKQNFIDAVKQKQPLVHISSHFLFRPGNEARSFLLLGNGMPFTLEELRQEKKLFEGVQLLTLSACNTAATQPDANGREIDGFAELAQRLGTSAVMATLWQVSDASTPWLMREFYANRQTKNGMNKAEALQKAQIALLDGTAKTKPFPSGEKGNSSKVKIVILPKNVKRSNNNETRGDVIYLDESEAPLYKSEGKPKYAHPYYWSPFVLFGNWK